MDNDINYLPYSFIGDVLALGDETAQHQQQVHEN